MLAYDRGSTLWDAARLLSVGEEGYAYRRAVGSRVRMLPAFNERPNYFDVATYGPTAESVARFLHRGSRIGVDGRLEWREWETAEHERRQAVSIVSDVVQFLDGPAASRTNADSEEPEDGGAEDERGEFADVGAEELEVAF